MSNFSKFTFVPLTKKVSQTLSSKQNQENLLKWGLAGHLKVKYYNFNQEFKVFDKKEFVESFFCDPSVFMDLDVLNSSNNWVPVGVAADRVEFMTVLCSETSMNFFNKLKNESNGIVRGGFLTECMDEYVDGLLLQDNLCQSLILEEHEAFNLYSSLEKQQFLFQLFKHICLGGSYCQRSQNLDEYLNLTKSLYKELIAVEKLERLKELRVRSVLMKVVAYRGDNSPLVPSNLEHPQNFMYLIVDPLKRQVAVLYHQFGSY